MSAPKQIGSLPPLPEWSKHDDLDGLVPSEIRVEVDAYGSACWNAGMNYALANAPKDALTDAAPELLAALISLTAGAEEMSVQIEGEWGSGRSIEQMEADGDMRKDILAARAAIAKATGAA